MRIHFGSAVPCLLRLGGASAGYCGETEKFADITQERLFAEFLPADGDLYPLSFLLDEAFFKHPPRCCNVYRYDCGRDVYAARFAPRGGGMRVLAQGRAGDTLATVFTAGGCAQIALDGGGGGALFPLPDAETYTLRELAFGGRSFAAVHCQKREGARLFLFAEGRCVFDEAADGYEADGVLTVRRTLADIAGHTIVRTFAEADGAFTEQTRTVCAREGFDPRSLPERVLPFALFEEIAAGGDPAPYLAPALAERAPLLKDYLGGFCAVTLPREIFYLTHGRVNAAGLVYPKAENVFDISFFFADVEKGMVTNIRPVE